MKPTDPKLPPVLQDLSNGKVAEERLVPVGRTGMMWREVDIDNIVNDFSPESRKATFLAIDDLGVSIRANQTEADASVETESLPAGRFEEEKLNQWVKQWVTANFQMTPDLIKKEEP